MLLKRKLIINDIKIFDIDKKWGESGYNIADLLNMPFYWAGWDQNPHSSEGYLNIAKNTALNNKDTLLGQYYLTRTDDNEKIPNLNRLTNVIDNYIEKKNIKNSNIYRYLNDDSILFVHIRSGDFGYISNEYIQIIHNLSKKYSKVILMSGVNRNIHHTDENSEHNLAIKNNLLYSFNKALNTNTNVYVYLTEPDMHISAMRLCKNLLVHRGGYSVTGTFICEGNIFYTNELPCINNDNWINEMKNKNIFKLNSI